MTCYRHVAQLSSNYNKFCDLMKVSKDVLLNAMKRALFSVDIISLVRMMPVLIESS